jgi:hypothetical protein
MFFFLCVFFCVVRCGTRSLSRRVPCPLLKVVLEAKNRPPKKLCFLFFILFVLFIFIVFINLFYFFYFRLIKIWPIFSILGYLNAFCCLFVAKLPLTFAKLNSIPLNRARGPFFHDGSSPGIFCCLFFQVWFDRMLVDISEGCL